MIMRLFLLLVIVFVRIDQSIAQQSFVVSGYVTDATNGEVLVGTNVYEINLNQGTSTNQYGFFSLTVLSDSALIRFTYQGFEPQTLVFYPLSEEIQRIEMQPTVIEFDSLLVVEADEYEGLQEQLQMSTVKISMAEVESLPNLLGEADLLKIFQLMPGIQSGAEGSTGLYVRGGNPGETLILLDGATVYNAGHLFGFMSTFNTDAINSAELVKGGFPARYGGRLSGVLDVTMRDGNRKSFEGRGAVGLVASRITLEGPIAKDKSSFIVSARTTYLDAIHRGIQMIRGSDDYLRGYYFYDVNAKWNLESSQRDRIYVSFYAGNDKGYETSEELLGGVTDAYDFEIGWSNMTMTARWNRVINSRMFLNSTLLFSRFRSAILDDSRLSDVNGRTEFMSQYSSGLMDYGAKINFEYFPHQAHHLRFGSSLLRHQFTPTRQFYSEIDTELDIDTSIVVDHSKVYSTEWYVFAEDEVTLTRNFKANVGVHMSGYHSNATTYTSLQPRIATSYVLPNDWALKLSYAHMQQYIQLLSNSGTGLPTDLWLPSTSRIPPQKSWQVAGGIVRTFDRLALDVSLEAYYKNIDQVIAYKAGSNFVGSNRDWEDVVTSGRGWAYGTEILLRRKRGKTTGWIGYTLSWSNRRFPDLNQGRSFPHRYDRRHDISIALVREHGRRTYSLTWVFSTGHSVSLPTSQYREEGQLIEVYESRNSYRMPSYHRLDLSVHFPAGKRTRSEFIVSLYNAYNRHNTFFIEPRDYRSLDPFLGYIQEERSLTKVTIFPIIPSFSYRFYF